MMIVFQLCVMLIAVVGFCCLYVLVCGGWSQSISMAESVRLQARARKMLGSLPQNEQAHEAWQVDFRDLYAKLLDQCARADWWTQMGAAAMITAGSIAILIAMKA